MSTLSIDPDRLAPLVPHIGGAGFGAAMLELFDPEFAICNCAAFRRVGARAQPQIPVAAVRGGVIEDAVALKGCLDWAELDFWCDPIVGEIERRTQATPGVHFFNFPATAAPTPGLRRMLDRYYDPVDIGEEADITVRLGDELIALSLFRQRSAGPFHEAQRDAIRKVGSFLLSCTGHHAALTARAEEPVQAPSPAPAPPARPTWIDSKQERFARLRAGLLMECPELSLRESEVCAYIVMGYSTLAIGLLLEISTNTVATHRKRAYAKLGLSSQSQLFDICMRHCATA